MKAPVSVGDLVADRYRVERVIGVGGMGVVIAARHVSLDQRVAIKFLLEAAPLRPDRLARFRREGRAAAQIRSEHVARVLDDGALPTGEPFLVMEYLDGLDLGAVLGAGGPLPVETAVGYALQVCEALAEMHGLGIVHRDLKPSNLFLTRRTDGSPVIKVIDFGISKRGIETSDAPLTDSAVVFGTPRYMAPEQMRSTRDVDARADLWALGAILHGLMTGAPPFAGGSVLEIHDSILAGAPRLRDALPDAPAGLEAVLLRCLQQRPEDRYADVADLAADLAAFGPPEGAIAARRARVILHPAPREEPAGPAAAATSAEPAGSTTITRAASVPGPVAFAARPAAARGAPAPAIGTDAPVASTAAPAGAGATRRAPMNPGADAGEPVAERRAPTTRARRRAWASAAVLATLASMAAVGSWRWPPARGQEPYDLDKGPRARTFQALDPGRVVVRRLDNTLWLDQAPFGRLPPGQLRLAGTTRAFQVLSADGAEYLFELGTNLKLWRDAHPFDKGRPLDKQQVAREVQSFQALDAERVLVIGAKGDLWLVHVPMGKVPGTPIAVDVRAFHARSERVLVLGYDGLLSLRPAPLEKGTPGTPIDTNVVAFQDLDDAHLLVLRDDGDLWLEQPPFGRAPPGKPLDRKVRAFQALDAEQVFVLHTNGDLRLGGEPVAEVVHAFQALDAAHVFILDTHGDLWLVEAPFGEVPPQRVDEHVVTFG